MSKGVVTKRLTWEAVTPFPDNPVYPGRLDQMRREHGGYRPEIVGSPAVFDNSALAFPDLPPETLFIGDGNHRYMLAREDQALDDEFIASLYKGLSKGAMYGTRRGLNDRRTVKPAERFLALAEENANSPQRKIKDTVEGLGWEITYERADGGLSCTNELEWIWTRSSTAMVRAIQTFEAIWGDKESNSQARVIKGLGAFWLKYPNADRERLIKSVGKASVNEIYRAGKNQNDLLPFIKSVYDGVAYVLAQGYNKQQRGGRLEIAS